MILLLDSMKNIVIRKSNDRGYFHHGWLETYHTFSFADYYDPEFIGFGNLRVINDDVVLPNNGFGLHPHKNMEIVTYIIDGVLTHTDNLGNKEEIKTGEVQVMSAGSGITHSEWNYGDKPCHLLQIWIKSKQIGGDPSYKIYKVDHFEKWGLIASGFEEKSTVKIKQDAEIYLINSGSLIEIDLPDSNSKMRWIHVAAGEIEIENITLRAGDAIGFTSNEYNKNIKFNLESRVLVFYI
jgi:redox-sensitive bicupin YhaK (pirin superfamily)